MAGGTNFVTTLFVFYFLDRFLNNLINAWSRLFQFSKDSIVVVYIIVLVLLHNSSALQRHWRYVGQVVVQQHHLPRKGRTTLIVLNNFNN